MSETRWELELLLPRPIAPLSVFVYVVPWTSRDADLLRLPPPGGVIAAGANAADGARCPETEQHAEQVAMWATAARFGVPLAEFGPLVCGGLGMPVL